MNYFDFEKKAAIQKDRRESVAEGTLNPTYNSQILTSCRAARYELQHWGHKPGAREVMDYSNEDWFPRSPKNFKEAVAEIQRLTQWNPLGRQRDVLFIISEPVLLKEAFTFDEWLDATDNIRIEPTGYPMPGGGVVVAVSEKEWREKVLPLIKK